MSINLGLVSESEYNCIVGFSGKLLIKKNLEHRIKTRPKILLIHGDMDTIVPPNNLLESKDFLLRQKKLMLIQKLYKIVNIIYLHKPQV